MALTLLSMSALEEKHFWLKCNRRLDGDFFSVYKKL